MTRYELAALTAVLERAKLGLYITYKELNAALPADQVSSEDIEDVMTMLSELGVNVVTTEEDEPLSDKFAAPASTIPAAKLPTPEARPVFIGDEYGYGWEIRAIVTPEEWGEIQSILQRRERGA